MSSQSSGHVRPPIPRAASGSFPPRRPTRTLSAHHLSLATNNLQGAKGSHGNIASTGVTVRSPETATDVVDLTSGGASACPGSANGLPSASNEQSYGQTGIAKAPDTLSFDSSAPPQSRGLTTKGKHDRKGRPKMRYTDGAEKVMTDNDIKTDPDEKEDEQAMPLPTRPGREGDPRTEQLQQAIHNVHQVRTKRAKGIPSIVNLEPPQDARKYPDSKPADFTPWTGTAVEDHLTDKLIKGGFQSTPLVSIHDSNTARPQLWSGLKSKAGLQTLSNIFCNVLERRQQSGKLTAPSTFKPPPRVALTDKSKETWLLELANATVPLRKLSRRIPHGIRGKGLLEECLAKNIPPARAVWLAKCVGANEMRAFKRKGAGAVSTAALGSEAKWVKEWTSQVQQFHESVLSTCDGRPEWKANVQYSIRLVAFLYSEHLLDQEHYLDWILTGLQGSVPERLPFWLLLTQIYWKDLTAVRRRGRHLAEALLSQLNATDESDEDLNNLLTRRMRQCLTVLVTRHRACMIAPRTWAKCKATVQGLSRWNEAAALASAIANITARNEAMSSQGSNNSTLRGSPRRELLKVLDSYLMDLSKPWDLGQLSNACLECGLPCEQVITSTLRWSTTKYRAGEHRLYVVVRLLRKWRNSGIDTDSAILTYLNDIKADQTVNQSMVFKVIAELCRSRHFALGNYMQWLIASGAALSDEKSDPVDSPHMLLLAQVPATGLPNHVANLRATLLKGMNLSSVAEHIVELKSRVQSCVSQQESLAVLLAQLKLEKENLAVKYELSRWLRQEMASASQTILTASKDPEANPAEVRMSTISSRHFDVIRAVLEHVKDYVILADVLGIVTTSQDMVVLSSVADTLNLHAEVFAAIGAVGPLFKRLMERYAVCRATQPLERPFVLALFDLAGSLTTDGRLLQQLKMDLAHCEERASIAMCSPASDGMGELMYTSKGELSVEDQIERVLSSGTNIDEPAAARLFALIVSHMADQISKLMVSAETSHDSGISPFDNWLQRLRAFDERIFERLVNEWLTGLVLEQKHPSPLLAFALYTVVGADVGDLGKVMAAAKSTAQKMARIDKRRASNAALNLLAIMIPGGLELHPLVEPKYLHRFAIESKKLEPVLMDDLGELIEASCRNVDFTQVQQIVKVVCYPTLLDVLRRVAIRDIQNVTKSLHLNEPRNLTDVYQTIVARLLSQLLHPEDHEFNASETDMAGNIHNIVAEADEFTVPFCQLQIEFLLCQPSDANAPSQTSNDVALLRAIKHCMSGEDGSWADLLAGFGPNVTSKVREFAEEQTLALCADFVERTKQGLFQDASYDWHKERQLLQRYVGIIDTVAANGVKPVSSGRCLVVALERTQSISEHLGPALPVSNLDRGLEIMMKEWLGVLLHLCIMHQEALSEFPAAEQANAVSVLSSLLTRPALQHSQHLAERAFDLLALFSDTLTPEARASIARSELSRSNGDPRLTFLFSSTALPEAWLGLVTTMSATSAAVTSTPKSSAATASSPAPASPAHKHTQATSPRGAPSPTPTPGISRVNSQQNLAQVHMLQRQNSQQNLQRHPMQPPSSLLPKVGMSMVRGGLAQNSQAAQMQPAQGRQASQAWPPQHSRILQQGQRSVSTPVNPQVPLPTSSQTQQQALTSSASGSASGPSLPQQKIQYNPAVPFALRRWEILPDATVASAGPAGPAATAATNSYKGEANDTAISLALFGARKVV